MKNKIGCNYGNEVCLNNIDSLQALFIFPATSMLETVNVGQTNGVTILHPISFSMPKIEVENTFFRSVFVT